MNKNSIIWRLLHNCKHLYILSKHRIKLSHIKKQIVGNKKRLYYFGFPEHVNMGDLGQYYCVRKWLEENYGQYDIIECPSSVVLDKESGFKEYFDHTVQDEDLLVIHSGYNTNDLSTVSNKLNLFLMESYQKCKLIVLPQTVFFKEKQNMVASSRVFNARKNMVFMARDSISYQISCEMMPDNNVLLVPDIVTTLIGSRKENTKRNGIVLCHRHDGEMLYNDKDFRELASLLIDVDTCVVMDTTVNKSYKAIMRDLYGAMLEIIEQFEHSRIVITDRYHGMIYSLVSNTPVIVLRTTDHKVIEGYHILKKVYPDRIWFAESIAEAAEMCHKILECPQYNTLDDYFLREVYAKLPEKIEQVLNKNECVF